ncbi:hypothetical protein [Marinoscillum sp. MHG1-6]|uniref:hypothetical protein n=1 Tax=Marinoscillum sp. MHG1-6 TaxID=2959627 RepID=UPI002157A55C|nr:hypothetical protein [Marinoscillum sp. MHG1-6]
MHTIFEKNDILVIRNDGGMNCGFLRLLKSRGVLPTDSWILKMCGLGVKKATPKEVALKGGAEWIRSEWRPTHRLTDFENVWIGRKKSHSKRSGFKRWC